MNSSRLFFGVLLVVVISTTYVFVRSPALGARFEIRNDSAQEVAIEAMWRDQIREIGSIEAESSLLFRIKDEAAIVFAIRFADGRDLESEPMNFAPGKRFTVTVSDQSVDVLQDDAT